MGSKLIDQRTVIDDYDRTTDTGKVAKLETKHKSA